MVVNNSRTSRGIYEYSNQTERRLFKIQLINPPGLYNGQSLNTSKPSLPLGLAYVAASLENAGFFVHIIGAIGEAPSRIRRDGLLFRIGLDTREIVERIHSDTRVVGVSCMFSFLWPLTRQLIREIHKARPDVKIVCGGEHFTAMAEESMTQAPIDYIAMGEGEETVVELMDALASERSDFDNIPGIAWRSANGIRINPRRGRIRDVDDIPWPAWHLFNVKTYDDSNLVVGLHKGMTIPILATRGCPYQCTYCSSPSMWTRLWVTRDPMDVVDEIEHYVKEHGASNFPFQDLTAIIKKDWIVRFCNELIRRKLNIIWQLASGTRCEVVDDEVASLLYRSGGKYLAFAPESGSERTRSLIKKKMTAEALLNSVRASVRNHLSITTFLVIGFPHDTMEDLQKTLKLARRLAVEGVEDVAVNFFFPIPNTELHGKLVEKGRVAMDDRFFMTPLFTNNLRLERENNYCESISAFRLTFMKYWILLNFYFVSLATHPRRVWRIVRNACSSEEESKIEVFLHELGRRFKLLFRRFRPAIF